MLSSLNKRMTRGAAWMLLVKLVERSLALVSTLILVRLLAPADFGLVAMAMSVIVMAELLSAFGFDIALIQRQSVSEEHYHSAWACNVLLGLGVALVLVLAAAPERSAARRASRTWMRAASSGRTRTACGSAGSRGDCIRVTRRRELRASPAPPREPALQSGGSRADTTGMEWTITAATAPTSTNRC